MASSALIRLVFKTGINCTVSPRPQQPASTRKALSHNPNVAIKMSKEIPVLDYTLLTSNPAKFVQDLKQAASEWGFFFLKNHNIPQSEVDKNFALAEQFFHGPKPGDEFKINEHNIGYSGRWQEGYGMDDHISYNFSGRYRMPMTLPPLLAADYDRIQEFKKSVWDLALELLRGFAVALDLEPDHFAKWHDFNKDPGMNLRFMYYPENHTPDEGQTRIREHSDFGTITVLFQKDVGGLEVLSPSGTWVTAPVIPGAPLINIGDFLQVSYPRFYP
jgi:isopenicillin N synthase-like dioxygenase